jgi:hypothetical protein
VIFEQSQGVRCFTHYVSDKQGSNIHLPRCVSTFDRRSRSPSADAVEASTDVSKIVLNTPKALSTEVRRKVSATATVEGEDNRAAARNPSRSALTRDRKVTATVSSRMSCWTLMDESDVVLGRWSGRAATGK